MSYELGIEEKRSIIDNQLRNISYRKFVAEMELVSETAVENPVQARISELHKEVKKCEDQLVAMTAEKDKLGI